MKAILTVLLAGFLLDAAIAQQQPGDPALIQKAITVLRAQRNEATDRLAGEAAQSMILSEENARLKAEIEALKAKIASAPAADDAK